MLGDETLDDGGEVQARVVEGHGLGAGGLVAVGGRLVGRLFGLIGGLFPRRLLDIRRGGRQPRLAAWAAAAPQNPRSNRARIIMTLFYIDLAQTAKICARVWIRQTLTCSAPSIISLRGWPASSMSRSTTCLKTGLKLSAGQAAIFVAWMTVPFVIKPLFGPLTDLVRLPGGRRRPHLLLGAVLGVACWLALALLPDYRYGALLALLALVNVSVVFCDVVCEGVMVEMGKARGKTGTYQAVHIGTLYAPPAITGVGEAGWRRMLRFGRRDRGRRRPRRSRPRP